MKAMMNPLQSRVGTFAFYTSTPAALALRRRFTSELEPRDFGRPYVDATPVRKKERCGGGQRLYGTLGNRWWPVSVGRRRLDADRVRRRLCRWVPQVLAFGAGFSHGRLSYSGPRRWVFGLVSRYQSI